MQNLKEIIFNITNNYYENIDEIFKDDLNKNNILAEIEKIKFGYIEKIEKMEEKPFLINVSGIPGAGKSTYCKKKLQGEEKFLYVSFDKIMEDISFYQIDAKKDFKKAFLKWELPCRVLGYEVLTHCIKAKCPVLFEHSSANKMHVELFKYIKNQCGYKIEMCFIPISIEDAYSRIKKREIETNRHTPIELIIKRNEALENLIPQYKKIVDVFIEEK